MQFELEQFNDKVISIVKCRYNGGMDSMFLYDNKPLFTHSVLYDFSNNDDKNYITIYGFRQYKDLIKDYLQEKFNITIELEYEQPMLFNGFIVSFSNNLQ